MDEWAAVRAWAQDPGDATTIRRRVLIAFEQAEVEEDPARPRCTADLHDHRRRTDRVELAGIIAEMAHRTLRGQFPPD